MNDKIQELTDRLYEEGLSKGQAEGEQVLAAAREESARIVKNAKAEAEAILAKAQKDAEDLKAKAESDVRMASEQALQATRKDIENMVVSGISAAPVQDTLKDSAFLKEVIKAVAQKFSAQEAGDIALVLPQSLSKELEPFVSSELSALLGKGVQATFSKKIAGGFTIGPKDGSYFISMTDETFKSLIAEYLRPVTKKLLFG